MSPDAIKGKDIAENEVPNLPTVDEILGYKQVNFRLTQSEYKELKEVADGASMSPTLLAKHSVQAIIKQAGGNVNGGERTARLDEQTERAHGASRAGAESATKAGSAKGSINWLH